MKTYKLEQKDGVGRGGIAGWKCVVQSADFIHKATGNLCAEAC